MPRAGRPRPWAFFPMPGVDNVVRISAMNTSALLPSALLTLAALFAAPAQSDTIAVNQVGY
ncbi:hypothetical protein ACYT69_11415, partial [Streptococcus pyogenes]